MCKVTVKSQLTDVKNEKKINVQDCGECGLSCSCWGQEPGAPPLRTTLMRVFNLDLRFVVCGRRHRRMCEQHLASGRRVAIRKAALTAAAKSVSMAMASLADITFPALQH